MQHDYRKKIYESYISNGFGRVHTNEKRYQMQKKYFERNYLQYLPKRKDSMICDLGCGCGEFVRFLTECGYKHVIGVDASKENVQFCCGGGQAKFVCEDIETFLDSSQNKYDAVIFNDVIEHLTKEEIIRILEKIRNSIKLSGCLMVKTPNMANPFVNTTGRYIDFTHEIGFTEFSLNQVLKATGYKDIYIKGTDIYVVNPVISIIARITSKIMNAILYIFSSLYGRTTIRIFEKDILAIAYKR